MSGRPGAALVQHDEQFEEPLALRRVLGYLPQDAGVYPHLNAREFLSYVAALKRLATRAARAQIDDLLDALVWMRRKAKKHQPVDDLIDALIDMRRKTKKKVAKRRRTKAAKR